MRENIHVCASLQPEQSLGNHQGMKEDCQEDKAGFLLVQPPPPALGLTLFWMADPRWADEASQLSRPAYCFGPMPRADTTEQ